MNPLPDTLTFLTQALAADPVTALAHAAAWLDPIGLMPEIDDEVIYDDDPVATALWVTRTAFPAVYADVVQVLRAGGDSATVDALVCDALTARGLPVDDIAHLSWGIPLPAYGAEIHEPEFYDTHPEAAHALAAFGVLLNAEGYHVYLPDHGYSAAYQLGKTLIQHPDANWQQVGWALGWLWGCTGNSITDYDWETMCQCEPLDWTPDDVDFAIEMLREADDIMTQARNGLEWLTRHPAAYTALHRNIQLVYHTIETKGPDHVDTLTFDWPAADRGSDRGADAAA